MKDEINKFAVFVGSAWAYQKHDVSIATKGGDPIHLVIPHTPEYLNHWFMSLRQQYFEGQSN